MRLHYVTNDVIIITATAAAAAAAAAYAVDNPSDGGPPSKYWFRSLALLLPAKN